MKIKLRFDSDLSWTTEKIVEVQSHVSESDVKALFQTVLNVPYNEETCDYMGLDGEIIKDKEVLAYTE